MYIKVLFPDHRPTGKKLKADNSPNIPKLGKEYDIKIARSIEAPGPEKTHTVLVKLFNEHRLIDQIVQ